MNSVKIIIRKTGLIYSKHPICFVDYISSLNVQAKLFPGFINSYSFWEKDLETKYIYDKADINKNKIANIVTICDWKTTDNWKNWLESTERQKIKKDYNSVVVDEKFLKLVENKSNNVFLL